jgi:hypothetical protein
MGVSRLSVGALPIVTAQVTGVQMFFSDRVVRYCHLNGLGICLEKDEIQFLRITPRLLWANSVWVRSLKVRRQPWHP